MSNDKEDTKNSITVHSDATDSKASDIEPSSLSRSAQWTAIIDHVRQPILQLLQGITGIAARNPWSVIGSVTIFSIGIFVLGIATNFSMDTDGDVLWTPKNSAPVRHMKWIDDESGFPEQQRLFTLIFHQSGDDGVLGMNQVKHIFEAIDSVRNLPKYDAVCAASNSGTCALSGVTKFWNNSATIFETEVLSDEDTIVTMSALNFPDDGTPVADNSIFGYAVRDTNDLLVSAKSYLISIEFPMTDEAEEFESDALQSILELDEKWEADSSESLRVEVIAFRSFDDEFERAVVDDVPLLPIVFIVMSIFTCTVFFKKDRIRSRSHLGFNATVSVLLSILTGYGLMFVCGVPFTSMTPILPFVIFGVGLDDAFIIMGEYSRTDPSKSPEDRIHATVNDVGLSITLTTLTSTLAFGLGCLSSIPAIFYLCLYAFPTITFVFLYQLTFFIACIVLDERRIIANRRDCLRCFAFRNQEDENEDNQMQVIRSSADSFMRKYAETLLVPWVKATVLLTFAVITIACGVSTSKLHQAFKFTDVLPADSYITPFFNALDDYTARSSVSVGAYFRHVDQSDPYVQQQMEDYVNDLVGIDAIVDQPSFFWLRDFKTFVAEGSGKVDTMDFNAQMDAFLADSVYKELYSDHIVRDDVTGVVTATRCIIPMDNIDLENVKEQIKALEDQRRVSESAPINQGYQNELRFFSYEGSYNIWEFYRVSADEIAFTTIMGVVAVTAVAIIFVPHWTAAFFVLPMISILYLDLLGVMQWAGVKINPVSYIALVMSIGLLVDFVMHVLLRYYESPGNRKQKVIHMLETMGSSIFVGAISTLLGTMPLAFSSSDIFHTIFIAFVGLVSLGATHGLVLLPVVLSLIGPEDQIGFPNDDILEDIKMKKAEEDDMNSKFQTVLF